MAMIDKEKTTDLQLVLGVQSLIRSADVPGRPGKSELL